MASIEEGVNALGVDIGWQNNELQQANQMARQLDQGLMPDKQALNTTVGHIQTNLQHRTFGRRSRQIIKDLYNASQTPELQANVVGKLMGLNDVELLEELLNQDDNAPLRKLIGQEGVERLVAIGEIRNEGLKKEKLIGWASEAKRLEGSISEPVQPNSILDSLGVSPIDSDTLNLAILDEILTSPGNTPSSLATKFQGIPLPEFGSLFVEYIVSKAK